jgi:nucleoside-diphosphate-sugar epimerase
MRISVVGGSGFIGTRLVAALLRAGHDVRVFDKVPSAAFPDRVHLGDVRDAAAVKAALEGTEAVVDLAAEHRDDVRPLSRYFEVNVGGAENIVRAAEACGVARVIFTSSVAVYGNAAGPWHESTPSQPVNAYGESKAKAEAVYRRWADAAPATRSLTLVRPSVVFGPKNRGNVHTLIEQIRQGRFVMVGQGKTVKSIAYVENVVAFLAAQFANSAGTFLFNYSDKPDFTTDELVKRVRHLLGQDATSLRVPYPAALAAGYAFDLMAALSGRKLPLGSERVRKFCSESRVAVEALQSSGFQAPHSLDEGLALTVASFLEEAA